MSYDIYLKDRVTGETLQSEAPHEMAGGNYTFGGTTELWLNVTYNYAKWYYKEEVFGEAGIRTIYGMTGLESIPILENAIASLHGMDDDPDIVEKDYWSPTRTNAIKPLYQLLTFAQMRPDGIWDGD